MSSQDMSPSWRSLGKLASSRIQTYLQPRVGPQVERAKVWAGQQIRSRRSGEEKAGGIERVNLFPGWAVRRYRIGSDDAFELEVSISGFAASYRTEETATRSQRAFIRLAKGFAALPKITADAIDPDPIPELTPSTEELLAQKHLPPRPTEISDNFNIEDLERQFRHANRSGTSSASSSRSSSPDSRMTSTSSSASSTSSPPSPSGPPPTPPAAAMPAHVLRKLHANLESRLRPFWSTALSNRIVEVELFASPHMNDNDQLSQLARDENYGPVISGTATTGPDGSFQMRFKVLWEDLCLHPTALHIAFGEKFTEHDLLVSARILPQQVVSPDCSLQPYGHRSNPQPSSPISSPKVIRLPITCSPIRVISDIDDTVKLSNVLSGARAVFHNVFVKELRENIIPEMSEFYGNMFSKGVRFHYVSNGPYELLPVINEFLTLSQLPQGSIKLRSYGGRSLFNGLLSAPADRKRAGVLEVLEAFPESRFFLIGDTGEQDLELYAELARDRPNQILAVLVRDVDTGERIDDPTGTQQPSDTLPMKPEVMAQALERPGILRTVSGSLTSRASSLSSSISKTPSLKTTTEVDESGYFTAAPPPPPRYTAEPDGLSVRSLEMGLPIDEQPKATPGLQLPLPPNDFSSSPGIPPTSSRLSTQTITQPLTPTQGTPTTPYSSSAYSSGPYSGPYSGGPKPAASASKLSLTEADRKKYTLQMRVYMARTRIPEKIPLRVFRDPKECVEVDKVFEREGM